MSHRMHEHQQRAPYELADGRELTRYDAARARQSVRRGRERGVWIFIPAGELAAAGVDPHAAAPKYRVWGRPRGSVLVRLYKDWAPSSPREGGELDAVSPSDPEPSRGDGRNSG